MLIESLHEAIQSFNICGDGTKLNIKRNMYVYLHEISI